MSNNTETTPSKPPYQRANSNLNTPNANSTSNTNASNFTKLCTPSAIYRHLLDERKDQETDDNQNGNNIETHDIHKLNGLNVDYETDKEEVAIEASSGPSMLTVQLTAVMYGIINCILTVPCCYGFSMIIFNNSLFQPYLPLLAKLVLFSSAVHQVCFSLLSTLPFAIGQVQDAGLIFLSSMSTSIVLNLQHNKHQEFTDAEILATTVICIAISTAALGIVLILIGKFRLASVVSYLPMPVIGGYLAFIGFFCFKAGISMCTGITLNTPTDWLLLIQRKQMLLLIPGLIGGISLLYVCHNVRHYLALPTTMLSMPILFYIILLLSGYDLTQARDYGWLQPDSGESQFYSVFKLFDFPLVNWGVFPKQFITWLAMCFVVAFSSCLDVAAIEMDMGTNLDVNRELQVVGISNVASGILGGQTGSYIFSQTIFTYRTKLNSRTVGWTVAVIQLFLFILPYSILAFVPAFFFASCLVFIGVDLMFEWLIYVYTKLLLREYVVLLLTFIAINVFSIEAGMFLGILIASVNFLFNYASINQIENLTTSSSNVVRNVDSRAILDIRRGHIVTLELKGFIFFGSAISIMSQVKKDVKVYVKKPIEKSRKNSLLFSSKSTPNLPKSNANDKTTDSNSETTRLLQSNNNTNSSPSLLSVSNTMRKSSSMPRFPNSHANYGSIKLNNNQQNYDSEDEKQSNSDTNSPIQITVENSDKVIWQLRALDDTIIHERAFPPNFNGLTNDYNEHIIRQANTPRRNSHHVVANNNTNASHNDEFQLETRYLILNFSAVQGLDVTAARQCFMILKQLCARHHITIVFCGLLPQIESLLAANGVLSKPDTINDIDPTTGLLKIPTCVCLPDLDSGLDFCETRLIKEAVYLHEMKHAKSHGFAKPKYQQLSNTSPRGEMPTKLRTCTGGDKHLLSGDVSVAEILKDYLKVGQIHMNALLNVPNPTLNNSSISNTIPKDFSLIEEYFDMRTYEDGQIIFRPGDLSDRVYILLTGEVSLYAPILHNERITTIPIVNNAATTTTTAHHNPEASATLNAIASAASTNSSSDIIRELTSVHCIRVSCQSSYSPAGYNLTTPLLPSYKLITRVRAGCIFGDLRFYLSERRQLLAVATSTCTVYWLTRAKLDRITAEKPHLATIFQTIIVKSMSLNISNSLLLNIH